MPMKTIEGYSKEKYTNTSVLLAGGGAKALSDFIGSISWDSTNKKIKYTPVGGSTTDLVTLSWDNIANKPTSLPANGGNADRAKFLETFQQNSTTTTYGAQYPIWAQWSDSTNVRLKCTNYTVWTDKANYADSAGNADTVDGQHFSYSNDSNSPTYLWATNSNGSSFLADRGSISVNYATSAGNTDTVDNEHASAFAHIGAHNNLIASGNEFTFASSGYNGNIWINYRTAGGLNGNITSYQLGNGKGDSLGYILTSSNWSSYISVPTVGNGTVTVTQAGSTIGSFTMNQSGNTLIALNDTNTNYYPIRSYTTGLQISSYSGSTNCELWVPDASNTQAGVVNTGTQTFGGAKTFTGAMTVNNTITFGTNDSYGIRTASDNYCRIGESTKRFYQCYVKNSYSTNGFYEDSDERLKNIIKSVKVDLDELSKLRKIYYIWKNPKENQSLQLGMIAQDVQRLYPELVSVDKETGYLSLAYDRISVIALEAIDTLYTEYKQLKERINELEKLLHSKEIL